MESTTQRPQITTAQMIQVIAETIHDTPEGAPTGVMYAAVMDQVSLETFNVILTALEQSGLIRLSNHVAYPTAKLAAL